MPKQAQMKPTSAAATRQMKQSSSRSMDILSRAASRQSQTPLPSKEHRPSQPYSPAGMTLKSTLPARGDEMDELDAYS